MKKNYFIYVTVILLLSISISLFFVFNVSTSNISNSSNENNNSNTKFVYENAKTSNLENVSIFNNFGGKNNDNVKFSTTYNNNILLVGETLSNSEYFENNNNSTKSLFVMQVNENCKTEKIAIKNFNEQFNIVKCFNYSNNIFALINTNTKCIIMQFNCNNFQFEKFLTLDENLASEIILINNYIYVSSVNNNLINIYKISLDLKDFELINQINNSNMINHNIIQINNEPYLIINNNENVTICNANNLKQEIKFEDATMLNFNYADNIYLILNTNLKYIQFVTLSPSLEILNCYNLKNDATEIQIIINVNSINVIYNSNLKSYITEFCKHGDFLYSYEVVNNLNNVKFIKNENSNFILVYYSNMNYNFSIINSFTPNNNIIFKVPASLNNNLNNLVYLNNNYYVIGNIVYTDELIEYNFGETDFYVAKLK